MILLQKFFCIRMIFVAAMVVMFSQLSAPSLAQEQDVCSENAKELVLKGVSAYGQSQYIKAIGEYETARNLDPQCFPAYLGLGGAYTASLEHEKVIEVFESAIVQFPDQEWFFRIGILAALFQLERYSQAVEYSKITVEKFPEMVESYYWLGASYMRVGDIQNARQNFEKALSMSQIENNAVMSQQIKKALLNLENQ